MNFDFVQLIITSRRDERTGAVLSRVRVSNVREREVADDAVRVGAPARGNAHDAHDGARSDDARERRWC